MFLRRVRSLDLHGGLHAANLRLTGRPQKQREQWGAGLPGAAPGYARGVDGAPTPSNHLPPRPAGALS